MPMNFLIPSKLIVDPCCYNISDVAKEIIKNVYYEDNPNVAEKLINGNDKTTYNKLVEKIKELNNLTPETEDIPQINAIIRIPTFDEFQKLMPSFPSNGKKETLHIKEENPPNTIIISPGHGMDRPGSDHGASDPNGIKEINYIYRFTQFLYPEMEKLGINYVNLKKIIEDTSEKDHSANNKIIKSNEIYDRGNVKLHFAIHADRNTHGYEGVKLFYIDKKEISKKIADFFSNKLKTVGIETRVLPDTEDNVNVGSLGELRRTKAPAAYIEIGSMDTPSSIKILNDRMRILAKALAEAIKAFIIERPNR